MSIDVQTRLAELGVVWRETTDPVTVVEVEERVRSDRSADPPRAQPAGRSRRLWPLVAAMVLLVVMVGALVSVGSEGGGDAAVSSPTVSVPTVAPVAPTLPEPTTAPSATALDEPATTTSMTPAIAPTTVPGEAIPALAIGDNVMLAAADELTDAGFVVSAGVPRQLVDTISFVEELEDAGVFGSVVVIHLGTNGPFTADQLDRLLAPLADVPRVVMVTVHADRSWTTNNNALLAARDQPDDNLVLVDWSTLADTCEGQCLAADGIHLAGDGRAFYANMIVQAAGLATE